MIPRPRSPHRSLSVALVLLLLSLSAAAPAPAQEPVPTEGLFSDLHVRGIGPSMFSGRIDATAVHEDNPFLYYVGATTGGLWKTDNNGTTWEVLFDDVDEVVSIGALTIDQADPDVVWVGTGGTQSWGNGVYRSIDGGQTWEHMGLEHTKTVEEILLEPGNPDTVWVAATGNAWAPHPERGVFKSTDGGRTWNRSLFIDEDTGAADLIIHPTNPDVLWATMYQRRSAPWGTNGGGPGSGIFKTVDGGETWERLSGGLPEGPLGVIGVDVHRDDPDILYAMVEHSGGKDVYYSDDGGHSWEKRNEPEGPEYRGHSMRFFNHVFVDPEDPHRVYVPGVNIYMSEDGGRTFRHNESAVQSGLWPETSGLYPYNTSSHSDHRSFWINPRNPEHLISGTDGGVAVSYDRGATWDVIDNMDLGQFYHVGYDMDWPYRVYGGLQDNLGWGGPSAERSYLGIGAGGWFLIAGGDGFVSLADPENSRMIFAESQNGNMARVDRLTNERQPIRPDLPGSEEELRWGFDTPMIISPHDSQLLYMGANRLFRSPDQGLSWEVISPDLSEQVDPDELTLMEVAGKDFEVGRVRSYYSTVAAIAESPVRQGLLYTGADDGTVHVSPDDGSTWTDLTGRFPGLPERTPTESIVASAHDESVVYASFDGHQLGDFTPWVFASDDGGESWRRISQGLPDGEIVRALTEDPRNPDVLYVGTETGLFLTLDRGATWQRFRGDLPTVPVYEIKVHPRENDLILATWGRGIRILDDITPIQEATDALQGDAFLFSMRRAVQFNPAHDKWWMWGDRRYWGENPPFGAVIGFWVRDTPESLELVVTNAAGDEVRRVTTDELADKARPGIHRIAWNLRYDPLPEPPKAHPHNRSVPEGVVAFFSGGQKKAHSYQEVERDVLRPRTASFVPPGEYTVTLVVNGEPAGNRPLVIEPDPLVEIDAADRRSWHDASVTLHGLQRRAYEGVEQVVGLGERLELAWEADERGAVPVPHDEETMEQLKSDLASLRHRFGVGSDETLGGDSGGAPGDLPGQIASLKMELLGATAALTERQTRRLGEVEADLEAALSALADFRGHEAPLVSPSGAGDAASRREPRP